MLPAFNAAKTVRRAIDSVVSQTFRDLELIVIDDGSSDSTRAIASEYERDERVSVLTQQNSGPAAARNNGVRHSTGNLIAFLDADDFWHVRKLEQQVAAFEKATDLALCWTHRLWLRSDELDQASAVTIPEGITPARDVSFEEIFVRPYLGTPGVMMPRKLFEQLGGFRSDLHSAEDVDLWLRAAFGRRTACVELPLFFIVSSPGSVTARRMDGTYRDNLRVIDDFCASHPDFATSASHVVARARARVLEDLGSALLVKRQMKEARECLVHSLSNRFSWRAAYLLAKTLLPARAVRA